MLFPARRAHFAREVTITPFGGSPVTVDIPFRAAYTRVDMGTDGIQISTTGPTLGPVDLAYLSGLSVTVSADPETRTQAVVDGTTYDVDDVQPDGVGSVLLVLAEA